MNLTDEIQMPIWQEQLFTQLYTPRDGAVKACFVISH